MTNKHNNSSFFIFFSYIPVLKELQAYQIWAEQFERAKYDIYAVLAQKGDDITWGKPTTKGPIELETFSLLDVQEIRFLVNGNAVDIENPPPKGRKIELEFLLTTPKSICVPFTEVPLAAEWGKFLQRTLKNLQMPTP
ncbi:MAG: hypothetical protein LW859_15975 [Anabaena sp. 49633_E8]|nr:hypothetical protein [Anabaena sp. 49633_E8]